jgi:tetratricopeptide (TPR) repeat protein
VGLYLIFQGMALSQDYPFKPMYPFLLSNIGFDYEKLNMLDSALHFQEKARYIADTMKQKMSPLYSGILGDLGMVHARLGNTELAKGYFRESIDIKDFLSLGFAQYELANLCYKIGQSDSSLYYARLGFIIVKMPGNAGVAKRAVVDNVVTER